MKEKKINIDPKAKICIQWTTNSLDYTKEQEDTIIENFARKYGVPRDNIHVELVFKKDSNSNDSILNSENINSIQDPQFQQSLFEPYLKARGIEDYDLTELYKIDSRVNSLVDFDEFNKGKRWSLSWIRWGNFLSFGPDNYFDFTKLHGLIQLNGEPANESGKSTFARDLMHFAAFGRVSLEKAKKNEQLFNNYLPDENVLHVSCGIVIDGENYVIERELTRSKRDKKNPDKPRTVTNKVNFYRVLDNGDMEKLDDVQTTNLQGESTVKTSKIITEAIGSEADFDMIISADSKDLDNIISMKDTERGKMLSKWNGLSIIEKKEEIAKKLHSEDSEGQYCKIYNRGNLQTDIEELKRNIESQQEEIKGFKKNKEYAETQYSNEKTKRDALLSSMQKIDESLLKVDVITVEEKLNKIIEDGLNKKAELDKINKEIEEYGEISMDEDLYKAKQTERETLLIKITEINTQINTLLKSNEDLQSAEYCPVCKRKFDNVDNSELIKTNNKKIKQLEKERDEDTAKSNALSEEMIKMEGNRKLLQKKNQLILKQNAVTIELERGRNEYRETKQLINELNKNRDAIKKNNEIQTAINLSDANLSQFEETIKSMEKNITMYNANIDTNNKSIKEKEAIIVRIEEEIKSEKNWAHYLEIIGKNGISKMVLSHAIPIMNAAVNKLLDDCADFNIEIAMTDNKDIDFYLVRDGVKTKLSAASGLERTMSSIALRVILGKMSNLSRPPFLLLDEVLGTVARENYESVRKLFEKIKTEYEFILHICHIGELSDWHDSEITIVKKNNISTIKE